MLLGLLLLSTACTSPNTNRPLVYLELPAGGVEATAANFAPMVDWLNQELDRPVELVVGTDYAAGIEAMRYGHADIMRLGPSGFVSAESEVELVSIASVAKDSMDAMVYHSYIITRPGLTTLEGATFAYVDIGSASGYLLPATYIEKEGIVLGDILFAGSHPTVIEAVRNGMVDAGATCDTRIDAALEQGALKEGEVDIFWESAPIIRGAIVVRADMPEELRLEIQAAFFSAPEDVVSRCGLGSNRWGYPLPPEAFEPMREIQKYLGLIP